MLTLITAPFCNHFKASEFGEFGNSYKLDFERCYMWQLFISQLHAQIKWGQIKNRELGCLPRLWDTRKYTVVGINSCLFTSLETRCMVSIKLNLFNWQEPSPAVNGNVNVKSCLTVFSIAAKHSVFLGAHGGGVGVHIADTTSKPKFSHTAPLRGLTSFWCSRDFQVSVFCTFTPLYKLALQFYHLLSCNLTNFSSAETIQNDTWVQYFQLCRQSHRQKTTVWKSTWPLFPFVMHDDLYSFSTVVRVVQLSWIDCYIRALIFTRLASAVDRVGCTGRGECARYFHGQRSAVHLRRCWKLDGIRGNTLSVGVLRAGIYRG